MSEDGAKATWTAKSHFYRCQRCGTMLVTPHKAPYGEPYICIGPGGNGGCSCFMRWQFFDTVPDRFAGKVVWNPGRQPEGKTIL